MKWQVDSPVVLRFVLVADFAVVDSLLVDFPLAQGFARLVGLDQVRFVESFEAEGI